MAGIESRSHGRRAPFWVKAFALAAALLVIAFVAVHLLGGGIGHVAAHLSGNPVKIEDAPSMSSDH